MARASVVDRRGKKVSDRELPAELFEAQVNVPLIHQVVVAGMAALRRGTHSTKTRAQVSGGGRKPWRQKGTGRARHGSNRSPIWTGGGIAHGPRPRDHSLRVNKKMRRAALRGALTDALRSGKLAVVDELTFEEPKTKDAVAVLEALELRGRILLVLPEPESLVERSFRNLAHVKIAFARSLSVYDLIAADRVLFTRSALDALEGTGEGRGAAERASSSRTGGGPTASGRRRRPDQEGEPSEGRRRRGPASEETSAGPSAGGRS
jgi:large subunit ribosomal protein L4